MNSRGVIARLESERQALALMNHPAIAKVFDAGTTREGAPYFVMEYIAGIPVTTYCDNHKLSIRERLELFIRICEGVQHAHQKAIIHRDLKPSNILVTEEDGRAVPKIIDFGVAKALAQKLTADTLFTRGAMIGTPEYMSPEQALSSGEDIDTRTDVYSLGILLYELLAGAPPLDLRKIALDDFLRRLREEEPPKPNTKIRTQDQATSREVAQKRRTEPAALAKQMRGDLDSITLKALEKDRGRRYASSAELAADIGRYLKNEAVLAVPPSAAYRARKFARRYCAALVSAAAVMLVLMMAAGIIIWQSIRANREAAVAQREAAVAQAVNDFLQNDLLAQASPANQTEGNVDLHLEVRTALDRAAARIRGKFDGQPEVEASIRDTIGHTYMDLGLWAEAQPQLERALELHRRVLGPENQKTLKTSSRLGKIALRLGKYPEGDALLKKSLAVQRRVLGPEHPDTLYSMDTLIDAYAWQGKYAQAEPLYNQRLEIQRRMLGPEHPDTLYSMWTLANLYSAQGKYAQAEALCSQILEIQRRVLGPEHPDKLYSMNIHTLAGAYSEQGKYAQAEELYRHSLEIQRRALGPEHPDTLDSMENLADLYLAQGKYNQAEELYRQTQELQRHVIGFEYPDTLSGLAIVYLSEGRYMQSESLAREALQGFDKTAPDDWTRFACQSVLGAGLAALKRYPEAESALLSAYEGMRRREALLAPGYRARLKRAVRWIVELYDDWGKPEKAAEWRQVLQTIGQTRTP
jgi:non-specific serine/threonine protein kinase/serine/threonine-protein kinase